MEKLFRGSFDETNSQSMSSGIGFRQFDHKRVTNDVAPLSLRLSSSSVTQNRFHICALLSPCVFFSLMCLVAVCHTHLSVHDKACMNNCTCRLPHQILPGNKTESAPIKWNCCVCLDHCSPSVATELLNTCVFTENVSCSFY